MGFFALLTLWLFCATSFIAVAATSSLDPRGPQPPQNAAALADGGLFSNKEVAKSNDNALHLVFVVTTIPGFCGPFPPVFKQVLLQAKSSNKKSIFSNNTELTLLSNFKQCRWSLHDLKNGDDLELRTINTVDSHTIKSNRTLEFEKLIKKMVPKGVISADDSDTLTTSLYRYFMLEDYMTRNKVAHVLHFESENMIYGDMFPLLSTLRSSEKNYGSKVLAVAPSIHKRFLSASTLWIGSLGALHDFNEFLLLIFRNSTNEFSKYTTWLHEFACCKDKGLFPDANGVGLKPWALSDMTLLAYYRHLYHGRVKLFPTLPFDKKHFKTEVHNSHLTSNNASANSGHHHLKHLHLNISLYSQGGLEVSGDTAYGLFDSGRGGWGSHLSGGRQHQGITGKEEESQSVANRHIIEQAVTRFNCTVQMKCSIPDESRFVASKKSFHHLLRRALLENQSSSVNENVGSGNSIIIDLECYTRPFVSCGEGDHWTALWNLHIIKSDTSFGAFRSQPCHCKGAV